MMKKFAFCLILIAGQLLFGQQMESSNEASFELGSGLTFSFNDGAYQFALGGMIQPSFSFQGMSNSDTEYLFNAKRSYFNFSGTAVEEKVSFFLQTDFSLNQPLLDAWLSYQPWEELKITVGQKQTIGNNREMMLMEDQLQFPDRGLLSTVFSNTGREFGLFFEGKFGSESSFGIAPQIAVTSGDGRNSFGTDSRDVDLGGFKYAGRLDLYPFGFFSAGNDACIADLAHEESPKVVLGVAASFNDGASHVQGEGHGDFFLYNDQGGVQLPDYRQVYGDIWVKYQGFSLLGEYAIATATSLLGAYTNEAATEELVPTQISEYLALGRAINAQAGYVTKSGYALDLRYSTVNPEFEDNPNSIVRDNRAISVGFSRYFKGNDLKLQTAITSLQVSGAESQLQGELIFQLAF